MILERPFLLPLLAMATGLVVSDLTGFSLSLYSLSAFLVCLTLSTFLRIVPPFIICTVLFFFSWGVCSLTPWKIPDVSSNSIRHYATSTPLTVEGVISGRPVTTSTGASLVLHTEKVYSGRRTETVTGDVMLYVTKGELTFHRGDRIRCITKISIPRLLGLPGEFDFQRFLYFQGVAAIGRVSSQQEIVLIRSAVSEIPLRRIDLVAENLSEFIRTTIGGNDVSAVLTALLIGDQKRISPQLADAYTRAGVNHILSVSGFHVGIIAYFIISSVLLLASFSEKLALGCNLRRTVLVLTVPAMLLYLVLTGSAPATARSVIMLTVFVAALCAERETDPINALLFSAFILLSLHPPTLFDISFQLSFLALWGIVVIVPQVIGYIGLNTHSWRYSLAQFLVASCAASIATLVPVLFVFNQASLNGIFSNILIVPLLGYGAVLIGFCALPFMYLYHPLAKLLIHIAAKIVELSNWLVVQFSHLPVIHFYGTTAIHMALFLACMVVLTFVRNRSVKLISCVTCVGVGVVVQLNMPSAADGRLHVTMLSVGQAESVLIRLPDGKTMLVDGGGYLHENGRDFGERILAPALLKLGVRKIDHLIMTHSHPDHIGGFPYLTRTMDIGRFWESVSGGSGDDYMQLRANLANRKVPIGRLTSGDHIALPAGISLHVLSPHASSGKTEAENDEISMNEESLVFRLVYGDFSMLFTADAGIPVETRLVAAGDSLKSSVLKVGHHGSRYSTSEAFLDRVAPHVALISAGHDNRFGLPSRSTLDKLSKRGIRAYRTDEDGTIELVTDGKTWEVATPFHRQ